MAKNGNGNGKKKTNGKNGNGHNGGRPTRLTKKVQEALLEAIRRGHYYRTACELVGIHYDTFNTWRKKGEEGIEPYVEFSVALKKAKAEAIDEALRIVRNAPALDPKNWAAAMTFLERREPEHWGRRERIYAEHSGEVKLTIEWSEYDGKRRNGKKTAQD